MEYGSHISAEKKIIEDIQNLDISDEERKLLIAFALYIMTRTEKREGKK